MSEWPVDPSFEPLSPLDLREGVLEINAEGVTDGHVLTATGGVAGFAAPTGGGGGAPTGAQYLALANDATLTAERRFVVGDGISGADGGADGDYTVEVDHSFENIWLAEQRFNSHVIIPALGEIRDANDEAFISFQNQSPAGMNTNHMVVKNSGGNIRNEAAGTDTNISWVWESKGTGFFALQTGSNEGQIILNETQCLMTLDGDLALSFSNSATNKTTIIAEEEDLIIQTDVTGKDIVLNVDGSTTRAQFNTAGATLSGLLVDRDWSTTVASGEIAYLKSTSPNLKGVGSITMFESFNSSKCALWVHINVGGTVYKFPVWK